MVREEHGPTLLYSFETLLGHEKPVSRRRTDGACNSARSFMHVHVSRNGESGVGQLGGRGVGTRRNSQGRLVWRLGNMDLTVFLDAR